MLYQIFEIACELLQKVYANIKTMDLNDNIQVSVSLRLCSLCKKGMECVRRLYGICFSSFFTDQ